MLNSFDDGENATALILVVSDVLISTFTPGPGNISSALLASLHGYKNTLIYQGGLAGCGSVPDHVADWGDLGLAAARLPRA